MFVLLPVSTPVICARPRISPSLGPTALPPPATSLRARLASEVLRPPWPEWMLDALLELRMESVSGGLNKSSGRPGRRSPPDAARTTVCCALAASPLTLLDRLPCLTVPPQR